MLKIMFASKVGDGESGSVRGFNDGQVAATVQRSILPPEPARSGRKLRRIPGADHIQAYFSELFKICIFDLK